MATSAAASSPGTADDDLRTVLLLLNVQRGLLLDPDTRIPGAEPYRPRIIHLRNSGEAGEPDEEGTASWGLVPLHDAAAPAGSAALPAGEVVVDKKKSNAFTVLEEMISPDVEIVVVGVLSEYSVKSTIKAALGRGNSVILMHGAHGTYPHVELANNGNVTPAEKIAAQVEEELDLAGAMVLDMELLPNLFEGR
ncbi:Isochorismatase domain-containing protein [Mycena chlorophos]|uniref:Isochorismatase domain-containing protein n=1 Tax=Mycena chlorophos TaxID=658473 RepID=A0A8H6TH44_MYCCL|nr:Isochorismatase domain-containing protein [Mycena chlorophos]